MDCLEFRQQLASEPRSREPEFLAHRKDCRHCSEAWDRAQRLEQRLQNAVAIPVPNGLAERILLSQATRDRRRRAGGRRVSLALAASLLVAVIAGAGVWRYLDMHSLPAMAVAHIPGERAALDLTRPISARAVQAGFAGRGVSLAGPVPDNVTYVHDCVVGPYDAVHLVVRAAAEAVTVLYFPHKQMAHGEDFQRAQWHGREVPLGHGMLMMLAQSSGPFDTVEQSWRNALEGARGAALGEP